MLVAAPDCFPSAESVPMMNVSVLMIRLVPSSFSSCALTARRSSTGSSTRAWLMVPFCMKRLRSGGNRGVPSVSTFKFWKTPCPTEGGNVVKWIWSSGGGPSFEKASWPDMLIVVPWGMEAIRAIVAPEGGTVVEGICRKIPGSK